MPRRSEETAQGISEYVHCQMHVDNWSLVVVTRELNDCFVVMAFIII